MQVWPRQLTEMGNIYLRFGKPNTVVKRHHETFTIPMRFGIITRQVGSTTSASSSCASCCGECFELLHSDMLGNAKTRTGCPNCVLARTPCRCQNRWKTLNPRDTFSGRSRRICSSILDDGNHSTFTWRSSFSTGMAHRRNLPAERVGYAVRNACGLWTTGARTTVWRLQANPTQGQLSNWTKTTALQGLQRGVEEIDAENSS